MTRQQGLTLSGGRPAGAAALYLAQLRRCFWGWRYCFLVACCECELFLVGYFVVSGLGGISRTPAKSLILDSYGRCCTGALRSPLWDQGLSVTAAKTSDSVPDVARSAAAATTEAWGAGGGLCRLQRRPVCPCQPLEPPTPACGCSACPVWSRIMHNQGLELLATA